MSKPEQKNNYQEFLRKKKKFAKKLKQGKKFKDRDGDGLSDYEEKYIYGTDPKNPDTDGDGMKDGDEVKRGRNPRGPGTLKDLFIPHAGNNYLPQALKPKRLLFHAISVIIIKAIVVVFILFYPLSAWLNLDLALAEAKKIIELTNNLRQAIALPKLLENRQLTQAAWQKVEDMTINQYFAHISPAGLGLKNWLKKSGYKYLMAGENLAVGFSGAEEVVKAWKNSPTHYNNIIDRDFKEIGVALADGKFNQVDTAYIAQYFGAPTQAIGPTEKTVNKQEIETASSSVESTKQVVGQSGPEIKVKGINFAKKAPKSETTIATTVPTRLDKIDEEPEILSKNEIIIDQQATILSIKSDLLNQIKILQIEIILPADTISAEVIINNRKIILAAAPGQAKEWRGTGIINQIEEKNILNPLIPVSVAVKNSAGTIAYGRIDWDEIKMIKATPLEHYQFYKNNPAVAMAPIMNLSGLYFKLILSLALIALLLNIFIEIRKQHPHIIFSSFVFICLLLAIIIF